MKPVQSPSPVHPHSTPYCQDDNPHISGSDDFQAYDPLQQATLRRKDSPDADTCGIQDDWQK